MITFFPNIISLVVNLGKMFFDSMVTGIGGYHRTDPTSIHGRINKICYQRLNDE